MKNKLFNQAVYTIRKEKQKKRLGKMGLAEAANRYIQSGSMKKRLANLVRRVK